MLSQQTINTPIMIAPALYRVLGSTWSWHRLSELAVIFGKTPDELWQGYCIDSRYNMLSEKPVTHEPMYAASGADCDWKAFELWDSEASDCRSASVPAQDILVPAGWLRDLYQTGRKLAKWLPNVHYWYTQQNADPAAKRLLRVAIEDLMKEIETVPYHRLEGTGISMAKQVDEEITATVCGDFIEGIPAVCFSFSCENHVFLRIFMCEKDGKTVRLATSGGVNEIA